MLEDDLGATSPNKHHREVVEAFDPAHEFDPIHEKHRHINVVVAEMRQEGILQSGGAGCGQCPFL